MPDTNASLGGYGRPCALPWLSDLDHRWSRSGSVRESRFCSAHSSRSGSAVVTRKLTVRLFSYFGQPFLSGALPSFQGGARMGWLRSLCFMGRIFAPGTDNTHEQTRSWPPTTDAAAGSPRLAARGRGCSL